MKRNLPLLLLWLVAPSVQAQLPFFLRVAKQPSGLTATPPGRPVKLGVLVKLPEKKATSNPEPPDGAPWIVFSDRENNTTFRRPNGVTRFLKAGFMEAFYVLKERNGYLKLIRYDARLPVGNRFSRRAITNRQGVVYYGWAPKNHFLLLNQSYRSDDGRHAQLVSPVLANATVLSKPDQFLRADSVRTFTDPALRYPARTPSRLYELAYPFKQSESGQQVLIGRAGWFPPDSARQTMLGWVPRELLQPLGQRVFLEADTLVPSGQRGRLFDTPLAALSDRPDSAQISVPFPAVAWESMGPKFPVLGTCCAQDSQRIVQTHRLIPLLARRDIPVFSVGGQRITPPRLNQIRERQRTLNLIYVVENSAAMLSRWGELLNTVQFTITQILADTASPFRQLLTGAVVYHETGHDDSRRKSQVGHLPLGADPARLFTFLSRASPAGPAGESANPVPQPIRFGLEQAQKLLANRPDETNMIVLIGTRGDNQSVAGWTAVLDNLARIDCRMLVFQAYAPDDAAANDFVLQAKDLTLRAGQQSSQLKKAKLVRPSDVTPLTEFDLRLGSRNVYQLAYPDRSMVPGWVLFPRKQQSLLFKELAAATDSLLRQIGHENQSAVTNLEATFAQVNHLSDRVNPPLVSLTEQAGERLRFPLARLVTLGHLPYLSTAYTPIPGGPPAGWKYTVMLTTDEFEQVGRWLDLLAGDDIDPTVYPDRMRYYRRLRQAANAWGNPERGVANLGKLLANLLDLPVKNALFNRVDLRLVPEMDLLPNALLNQTLYLLRERRDYFQRIPTFPKSRFNSNGKTYYWISEDLFK